jgi:hypothetical protein
MATSRRERLVQEELRIKARIKQIDADEGEQNRKKDTRRKVLAGAAIFAKIERGEWSEEGFRKMMDAFLSRPSERALFDLPILNEPSEQSEESAIENNHSDPTDDRQLDEGGPRLSVT